jgi:hypothetical protein
MGYGVKQETLERKKGGYLRKGGRVEERADRKRRRGGRGKLLKTFDLSFLAILSLPRPILRPTPHRITVLLV